MLPLQDIEDNVSSAIQTLSQLKLTEYEEIREDKTCHVVGSPRI